MWDAAWDALLYYDPPSQAQVIIYQSIYQVPVHHYGGPPQLAHTSQEKYGVIILNEILHPWHICPGHITELVCFHDVSQIRIILRWFKSATPLWAINGSALRNFPRCIFFILTSATAYGWKKKGSFPLFPSTAPDPGGRHTFDPPHFSPSLVGDQFLSIVSGSESCSISSITGDKL